MSEQTSEIVRLARVAVMTNPDSAAWADVHARITALHDLRALFESTPDESAPAVAAERRGGGVTATPTHAVRLDGMPGNPSRSHATIGVVTGNLTGGRARIGISEHGPRGGSHTAGIIVGDAERRAIIIALGGTP